MSELSSALEQIRIPQEIEHITTQGTMSIEPDTFREAIDNVEVAHSNESLEYKGVRITGLSAFTEQGILTEKELTELLARLPEGYFRYVPLGEIRLEPDKMFAVDREGNTAFVKENDIQEGDIIQRRIRGLSQWNSEIVNGTSMISDGMMTIQVFSTKDWGDKPDGQTDTDIASYTLAHELGHTVFGFMTKAIPYYQYLHRNGKPLPKDIHPQWKTFMALAKGWQDQPENQLQRYQDYLPIFLKEIQRIEKGVKNPNVDSVRANEDLAISYEHDLYWQDLQELDPTRHAFILSINQLLDRHYPTAS